MTNDLLKLTTEELAERIVLLDLLDEICEEDDFDGIEGRVGLCRIDGFDQVKTHEEAGQVLMEAINGEVRRRIENLNNDVPDLSRADLIALFRDALDNEHFLINERVDGEAKRTTLHDLTDSLWNLPRAELLDEVKLIVQFRIKDVLTPSRAESRSARCRRLGT